MYTLTVKIAADGTVYTDPKDTHNSVTGHMWYSLSDGSLTESFGFAPAEEGSPFGDGKVYTTDDQYYRTTYYSGEIVITEEKYNKLIAFGNIAKLDGNPYDFDTYYNGLNNSCIDYTWKALYYAGINPSDFEGQTWPTWNADNVDKDLFKYLFGNTSGWDESLSDAGGYDVIYGSKGDDTLKSHSNTDAVYGGGGHDNIYGSSRNERLFGGTGNDFVDGGWGNDYIEGNDGNDDLSGANGSDTIYGGAGNDFIDGGALHDKLYGGTGNDTLIGGAGNDYLNGGTGSDTLHGSDEKYHNLITNNYKNLNQQDIMTDILKKVA